jgi:hypothetical protein
MHALRRDAPNSCLSCSPVLPLTLLYGSHGAVHNVDAVAAAGTFQHLHGPFADPGRSPMHLQLMLVMPSQHLG